MGVDLGTNKTFVSLGGLFQWFPWAPHGLMVSEQWEFLHSTRVVPKGPGRSGEDITQRHLHCDS